MFNSSIECQSLQETQNTIGMLPVGAASTPYRSIAIFDIQPGQDDIVATFSVKIGGITVRKVSLRRGRNDSTYINFPAFKNEHGRWAPVVEILSPALEAAVRQEIYQAVGEVVR